ncbi:MAG: cytochrome c [Pseudomonadota bacterium]
MKFVMAPIKTGILLAPALALMACGPVEDTRPGQPVKTRQEAFQGILRAFEPMGVMLRTQAYEPKKFEALAVELVGARTGPWSHFGPDTFYPPTKAKEAVWEQPQVFEEKRQAFFQATDALLVAARSHDRKQVAVAYEAVHDSCKACHSDFRNR